MVGKCELKISDVSHFYLKFSTLDRNVIINLFVTQVYEFTICGK